MSYSYNLSVYKWESYFFPYVVLVVFLCVFFRQICSLLKFICADASKEIDAIGKLSLCHPCSQIPPSPQTCHTRPQPGLTLHYSSIKGSGCTKCSLPWFRFSCCLYLAGLQRPDSLCPKRGHLPYYASQSTPLCLTICPTMPYTLPYYASYSALQCHILLTLPCSSPSNQHASQAGQATHDFATALLRFFPGFGNLDQMLVLHNRTLPRVSYLLNSWLVTLSVILLSVVQNKLSIYDSR